MGWNWIISSCDILRVSEICQNCRYAKKTQISLDLKKYRYVGGSAPRGCTEDEGRAPRGRLAGAGPKAPQAALVKSHCGER